MTWQRYDTRHGPVVGDRVRIDGKRTGKILHVGVREVDDPRWITDRHAWVEMSCGNDYAFEIVRLEYELVAGEPVSKPWVPIDAPVPPAPVLADVEVAVLAEVSTTPRLFELVAAGRLRPEDGARIMLRMKWNETPWLVRAWRVIFGGAQWA